MKKRTPTRKRIPAFKTDEKAEAFVEDTDLTEYDLSGATPVRFELAKKAAHRIAKPQRARR